MSGHHWFNNHHISNTILHTENVPTMVRREACEAFAVPLIPGAFRQHRIKCRSHGGCTGTVVVLFNHLQRSFKNLKTSPSVLFSLLRITVASGMKFAEKEEKKGHRQWLNFSTPNWAPILDGRDVWSRNFKSILSQKLEINVL
jgi:hypothetical protein